jgi:acetate kinase
MNETANRAGGVLVVNSGSSSLKFAVYMPGTPPIRDLRGTIDRHAGMLTWAGPDGASKREPFSAADRSAMAGQFLDWLARRVNLDSLAAVGHRVVHGGPRFDRPTRIDADLITELGRLAPFDPEHLPAEIGFIESVRGRLPTIPQVACFDTTFHRDLPDVARRLPLPRSLDDKGIRRYGFHGLSFAYLIEELTRLGGGTPPARVVLAHLGNGASLAAVQDGRCIDTTMGFSPAGGIPMSTRTGDLDPGVLQYLAAAEKMTPDALRDLVTRRAGLLGVSGVSGDMRELLRRESTDPHCREAVELFCYAVRKQIGAYAAALGGLDALVFSGGVGEHAAPVRARVCDGLGFLGIVLDDGRNAAGDGVVSTDTASVSVRVMPTDEERVIARETFAILGGSA